MKLKILSKFLTLIFLLTFITTPFAADTPQTTEPTIPTDYYRQLGMPDPTKAWAPFDYLQAAAVLNTIVQQTPRFLPHYNDPVAKPYAEHMVDGTNLYQILQYADSHEQRMELILLYLDGIQRIFAIYQQALSNGVPYYAEWVDIIGLSSYMAALSRPEWEYYLQNQEQGMAVEDLDAKFQAVTLLQTALINPVIVGVQASPKLPVQLAWRLVQELQYSMPQYAAQLPLSTQQQLQQAIEQAAAQAQDREVKMGLLGLVKEFTL
jgi:hypothetical protein